MPGHAGRFHQACPGAPFLCAGRKMRKRYKKTASFVTLM
ncbi:hypothetical protein B4096_2123 [Heyndrickxia coagulans]|nr:hypothetical protein B4096_2123 [Heyndrickxia coagulans]